MTIYAHHWVSGCSIPPYLNCDGSAFSSAFYPTLTLMAGGTTLPDFRGRYRATLNQGTGRLNSSYGLNGDVLTAAGGSPSVTLASSHIPPVPIQDPGHHHSYNGPSANQASNSPSTPVSAGSVGLNTGDATTGITAGSTSPEPFGILPPSVTGGITMVRAG